MSMSSTVSVPLILTSENCQRTVIFTIELTSGQVLSPAFTNENIIAGLVSEHGAHGGTKNRCKCYITGFPEGEEVAKICSTL